MSADVQMNQDSLTLEDTNAVRIKLGLKPIGETTEGEDGEEVVDEDAMAEDNYAERRREMDKAKRDAEVKERIEKAKNRSALNAKLKGSTLADVVKEDEMSAKDWLKVQKKRSKKRERELAERRQKDMEEQDKAVYDERLKVAHSADQFETGEDVILTLKDSRVLAGDEDELQNVNLIDDEAVRAAKERKRKAQEQYTGYDDEEFEEGRIGKKSEVLSKYDDEFSTGKVRTEGFRLGAPVVKDIVVDEDTEMIGSAPATKVKLNLDYAKDFETSDYLKEGDAGFKKPKKKRAKKSSRREEDGDEGEVTFAPRDAEEGPQNLVDDDDIQAALARSRREAAKRKPKVKTEALAAQIASNRQEDEVLVPQDDGDGDGRITFDDTSEFVRNVSLDALTRQVKVERATSPAPAQAGPSSSTSGANGAQKVITLERVDGEDEEMSEEEDDALAEMAAREGMSLEEYREKIDRQMQEMSELKPEDVEDPTSAEPVVGSGLSGYLSLLRNQGGLSKRNAEDAERERTQKEHDAWKADYRARMARQEIERLQARGKNVDQATREWENKMREKKEAQEQIDLFKNYNPDVQIAYHDEFGRNMTPKEAWKSLSHKFHGKTSGRMKTEKRLKKIADERNQAKMIASDTPLGMSDAFARRQQKTGEAHMVLSVGNKGSVQASDGKKVRR